MLQHQQSAEQETHLAIPPAVIASAHPAVETKPDPQVEDFLDRVFARLVAVLPYEERLARRDALRAQIEQSVAAHMELGSARHEALALTLAQIQREQAVASQAVPHIQQTRARPQASDRPATAAALSVFGLFYLLDQTRIAGHLWNMKFGGLYDEAGEVMHNSAAVAGFYRFEMLALPLLCGLAVGLLAKHRPVRGTLNALALLAIPAIIWGGLLYGLTYAGLIPNQAPEWLKFIFPNPIPAVCGIGAWSVLGALAAGAGGWLRRRMPRAKSAARSLGSRGRRILQKARWASRSHKVVDRPATPSP